MDQPRIFGIGEPKTGTATLGVCLRTLIRGNCASWAPVFALLWNGNEIDFDKLFERSKKYVCFHDFPWSYMDLYQRFDKAYPGSKFILTMRDSDKWFDSYRRWITKPGGEEDILWRLKKPRTTGALSNPDTRDKIIENFGNILRLQYEIDEIGPISHLKPHFIDAYEKRNASILEYFSDRPDDLLVVSWENGDGWEELCSFLDIPIPDAPFPHINKRKRING